MSGDRIGLNGDKEDFAEMDRYLATNEVNTFLKKKKPRVDKKIVDSMIEQRVEKQQELGDTRYIDISDKLVKRAFKKLLKEIDYIIEFNITDEAIDPGTKIKTILEADQIQNPKLRDRVLDLVGISPKELKESDEEKRKSLEEQVIKEGVLARAKAVPQGPPIVPPQVDKPTQ